jgi:hypothetical protein
MSTLLKNYLKHTIIWNLMLLAVPLSIAGIPNITCKVVTYPGAQSTFFNATDGVNIVGGYTLGNYQYGFSYSTNGAFKLINKPGFLNTYPNAISGNLIAGFYQDANFNFYGFLYDGMTFQQLLPILGCTNTQPTAIDNGNVLGGYQDSSGNWCGFLYSGGRYTTLNIPGTNTWPAALENNEIVGSYTVNGIQYGFSINNGSYTRLALPGTSNWASGLDSGSIVGTYFDYYGKAHGFINYGNSSRSIDFPGSDGTYLNSISGQYIVGTYSNSTGNYSFVTDGNNFSTIPVPETNTYVSQIKGNLIIGGGWYPNGNAFAYYANIITPKKAPVIGAFNIPKSVPYDSAQVTLIPPSSTSPGAWSYVSSNPNVAIVNANKLILKGTGTTVVTATQVASGDFSSGSVSANITVTAISPIIGNFNIPSHDYVDGGFLILTPPSSTSLGFWSYTSSNTNVAMVIGSVAFIKGAGTTSITAIQSAYGNYTSNNRTTSFVVNPIHPTVGPFSLASKIYSNGATFDLSPPTSSSAGKWSYSSSNTNVAIVNGNRVTLKAVGSTIITATQVAFGNYTSAIKTSSLKVNSK